MNRKLYYFIVVLVILGFALSACKPAAPTPAAAEQPTQAPTTVPEPTVTASPAGPQPIDNLENIQSATVQIVAEGTFVDPQVGLMMNAAGSGTGFIIDPEGIAVTNNHVVTGAALLKVYVAGEDRPRNARVLGVSECSDLAVIDIDGGDYPFMAWSSDEAKVGTDVYAAGFPLGDPEFTLTRGIISKARADGETSWASVDNVLEHDATINPGNSGGPLVNTKGQVMGINYAGSSSTNQYFAISPKEANDVIASLRKGEDVTSLGLNGQAVINEDGSLSGIWVSSVKSGSPADKAGIKAGDIVTQLENIVLATDGTMSDYCDILRSHKPTDTLNVTILRFAEQAILEGQINGRPLEPSISFAQELGQEVSDATGTDTTDGTYSEWVKVQDDSGAIEVEIPADWTDVDGSPWQTTWDIGSTSFEINAPSVSASPNLDNFYNSWDESGVFFAASSDLSRTGGYVQLLDGVKGWYENDCKIDSRNNYEDDLYEGKYDLWTNCGSNDNLVLILSARPKENHSDFLILVQVTITKESDLDALDHILNTFIVTGGV